MKTDPRLWQTLEAEQKESIQNSIQITGFWHVANEEWDENEKKKKKKMGQGSRLKENGGSFSYSYEMIV